MHQDYSKYSLDELYDVEEHIDQDTYPKRYQLILEQIRLKESITPEPLPSAEPTKADEVEAKPKSISSRIISIIFVAAFLIYSLVSGQIGAKGKVLSVTESPEVYWGIVIMLVSFILYDLFKIYRIKNGVKDT
ncbi:hypothetical protein A9267_05910 [Shewanella sp. UCD-FRSSP16_17]|uniref:hypothetical protein n=1 Tax=Shewanella sp. UCD-FRSSP16_17 TaxID=1853256 RepID=UPI0007EEBB1D|nr:hypothetical protein [Shewanella sp. UCD-FRSSP16_17]OBT10412.1 hypothetical protein A9267_05910 [Shewanella sp. UCD-FRSSP16_17]